MDGERVDNNTFAACYTDLTNATTGNPDDPDSTALMFAVTNDTGENWTIRKVNQKVDDAGDCDLEHRDEGSFGIAYIGGDNDNDRRWFNFTLTTNWGVSWGDTNIIEPSSGGKDPKLVHVPKSDRDPNISPGSSWQAYVTNLESGQDRDTKFINTTDNFLTIDTEETIASGVLAVNYHVDGPSDLWLSGKTAGSEDCRAKHWDGFPTGDEDVWNLTVAESVDGASCRVVELDNSDWVASMYGTTSEDYHIYNSSDEGATTMKINTLTSGQSDSSYQTDWLQTSEGLFIGFYEDSDTLRVCESDDGGSTFGCDDGSGPSRGQGLDLVRVNQTLPGAFSHITNENGEAVGLTFAWPSGAQ